MELDDKIDVAPKWIEAIFDRGGAKNLKALDAELLAKSRKFWLFIDNGGDH
jgi:hypothetical protein